MPTEFKTEFLTVDGCKVSVKRAGSGPTLLYLHGAGGAAMVEPFMIELAKSYDVLVPEHPGFGASDEPAWMDNIHDVAYFYLDFMERLKLTNVTLVGCSLGGWLALEMMVRSAERVRALSLIGPAGIYVDGLKRGDLFLWTPPEIIRNLFTNQAIADFILSIPPTPEMIETNIKNMHTFAKLAWEPRLFDPHLHKWLHRIKVPTQIVWGENDKILPVGYAAGFKKLIPHARVDIVPNCGHLPQTELPEQFMKVFREFTASIKQ
jgi:pimeloyl-ACP methyl ester carboxylesterase